MLTFVQAVGTKSAAEVERVFITCRHRGVFLGLSVDDITQELWFDVFFLGRGKQRDEVVKKLRIAHGAVGIEIAIVTKRDESGFLITTCQMRRNDTLDGDKGEILVKRMGDVVIVTFCHAGVEGAIERETVSGFRPTNLLVTNVIKNGVVILFVEVDYGNGITVGTKVVMIEAQHVNTTRSGKIGGTIFHEFESQIVVRRAKENVVEGVFGNGVEGILRKRVEKVTVRFPIARLNGRGELERVDATNDLVTMWRTRKFF